MADFDVVFAGLFCFKIEDHQVVMPDGRTPDDPTIPPLTPMLVADPKDIDASSGWEGNDPALTAQGIYTFGKCTIDITKATEPGTLDTTQHDTNVAKLFFLDRTFRFNAASRGIITTITLGQGTLQLLRRPNQDDANVSRLTVEYDGEIFVTVAVDGEAKPRVLQLKPRSAVAIANLPLPPITAGLTGNPSNLFGKIAQTGTFNTLVPIHVPGMAAIGANYQIFKVGIPIIASGPGGCCPPP